MDVYDRIPLMWCLIVIGLVVYFWFVFNVEKINKKQRDNKTKKEFEKLKEEHPEWAKELNPEEEKEKKDREEFERIARDHPDWL